jgi:hypothetical protein
MNLIYQIIILNLIKYKNSSDSKYINIGLKLKTKKVKENIN